MSALVGTVHEAEQARNFRQKFKKQKKTSSFSLAIAVTYGSELEDLSQAAKCFGLFYDKTHIAGAYKKSIR